MTFITGSITNANPGPALYAVIETAALADGWTLDDTVTIGGNTHKVLKSAAAGNTYALDWYLDINYPTTGTTGGIRFCPFEGYTAASDVATRGPRTGSSDSTIETTYYSRLGATTQALETTWANTASNTGLSTALTTSAFTYWVSITRNRIIVLLSNVGTSVAYAGFFTPTSAHTSHAGASLFPLVMAVINSGASAFASTSSTASMAFTRVPKSTSTNWGSNAGTDRLGLITSGQVGVADSLNTGQTLLSPLPVYMGAQAASSSVPGGSFVGTFDGLATGYVVSSAIRGDTVTVGSDTWYALAPSSSVTVFLKGV